jgi:hypothetical protein
MLAPLLTLLYDALICLSIHLFFLVSSLTFDNTAVFVYSINGPLSHNLTVHSVTRMCLSLRLRGRNKKRAVAYFSGRALYVTKTVETETQSQGIQATRRVVDTQ